MPDPDWSEQEREKARPEAERADRERCQGTDLIGQDALLRNWRPEAGIDALGSRQVLTLQRLVGNAGMSRLVGEDERKKSTVRDVVGKGRGASLPADVRSDMESRFGHDFSDVRIHRGQAATDSARSVGAKAFTVGHEVVFGAGHENLWSSAGQRTLAHELTHVVQQRGGPVESMPIASGIRMSHAGDRHEREAELAASTAVAGMRPQIAATVSGTASGANSVQVVQREEGEGDPEEKGDSSGLCG